MGKCLRQQLLGFFTADLLPNNVEDGPRRENHQKLFFNFPLALRVYFTVVVLHCTLSQSLLLPFDDACMVCKKKAQWELLLQNSSFFRRHGDLRRDRSFSASFLVSNVHTGKSSWGLLAKVVWYMQLLLHYLLWVGMYLSPIRKYYLRKFRYILQ